MSKHKVDLPALIMVVVFTANMVVSFWDRQRLSTPKEIGWSLLFLGVLLYFYVIFYLRKGFFGNTAPVLDHLITNGPYKFCRHPIYLSYTILVLGFDLLFGSFIGTVLTFSLSIPSVIYRGKKEDRELREKFGDAWERYSEEVGFLFPKF